MPFVQSRAGQVFYTEQGRGRPVVLLHAALHDHTDFDAVAEPLAAAGHRVLAVDWPGHGRSETPTRGPRSVAAPLLAGVLADLVAELDLERAVFVGNSVGGYAAARLALDHPDRVAGLVLVNAGGFVKVPRLAARALGVPAVNRAVFPRLVPRYMKPDSDRLHAITRRVQDRARSRTGAAVSAALWRSIADPAYDLRADGPRLGVPVLLAWGARDIILPMSAARQTQAAIPDADLRTLQTGHVAFAADPDGFLGLVLPFLESVETAGSAQ
ncbi:alpha/beta fold hydrolase [Actinomadura nitritigenes]|uniref:Alpha/beta hydrolase n=1 Tax=Actinomadura nitritigenes TaxID=134602 RepID=A0ABS3R913_9ACTN|nr:alpha/beta hydrolase [Actinomadura nitritigenes]MBO2442693.1 alpha/beta hydrolase [Actinomadura nitritigenes]